MIEKLTDTELLEQGLVLGTRDEAMQYWSAYKRYGTSQKHPVDAIFDMNEQKTEAFEYFVGFLLDNKKGETITEENLQFWLAESEKQKTKKPK